MVKAPLLPLYLELSALFEVHNRIYNEINNSINFLYSKESSITILRLLRSEFGYNTSNNSNGIKQLC